MFDTKVRVTISISILKTTQIPILDTQVGAILGSKVGTLAGVTFKFQIILALEPIYHTQLEK